MERHTMALKINRGKMNGYRRKLGEVWTDLTDFLDRNDIRNFSIWNAADLIFIYCESDDGLKLSEKEQDAAKEMTEKFDGTFTWISVPGENMRLMYENFGIVRKNKELIRHRMFMTKLKPGCEEEYKARHDVLAAQRGGVPDPGPDSNFSIWSAGGYIFGYDEIDTTMEVDETPETREGTISWETRQLEIMDWITNDVDWMTGEHHTASIRLAWHQGK
ncbi:MAG TPA: L-rhamnose mutarotase [Candidatus Mediterraneibacter norfolkensis]|nr:L-rhamnose mutarotase [Candidatus Mediterraneibacter norfolkensis]